MKKNNISIVDTSMKDYSIIVKLDEFDIITEIIIKIH